MIQNTVVKRTIGHCVYCDFNFCCDCGRSWHGNTLCPGILTKYLFGSEDDKAKLREKYGRQLTDLVEDAASAAWIQSNCRLCPSCKATTFKNGGCNHITCKVCSNQWCWECGDYYTEDHFVRPIAANNYAQGMCQQFDDDFFIALGVSRRAYYNLHARLLHG